MKVFGQDVDVIKNQVTALVLNLANWLFSFLPFAQSYHRSRKFPVDSKTRACVSISSPGGLDRLQLKELIDPVSARPQVTVGYNIPNIKPPFYTLPESLSSLPQDLVLVRTKYFSLNYADIAIRWGLYESALRYVGWPIVPGFDFSGEVVWAGSSTSFSEGDKVFGFTLFGAYSSDLLVPGSQVRRMPSKCSMEAGAALPAVAATALHALALSGGWPNPVMTSNRAALIHSAAGGVGSMLIQMCKAVGFNPVVAVVGSSHKVEYCRKLGADVVIDKSHSELWTEAKKASPAGFVAVFDANGVETLQSSYDQLIRCGRLVTYGFHSNLPKKSTLLSPLAWIRMIVDIIRMPKFDPMNMVLDSKSVLGFNLSFFAEEHELIKVYMEQILVWLDKEVIRSPECVTFDITEVDRAHELIQSGTSVGKIVVRVP